MPTAPPPLTFPRLMQDKHSGAVVLVAQRVRAQAPGAVADFVPTIHAYDTTCVHHGALPSPGTSWGAPMAPAAPKVAPDPIGYHTRDVTLGHLQDYGNTVYLSNGKG